uniref:Uncharacterized protein n=1 Tax=Dulem virus 42 TaxID=3145760 RepID=A0AAU8B8H1_9CAUD
MRNIYGKNDMTITDGTMYYGYNKVFKDDVV